MKKFLHYATIAAVTAGCSLSGFAQKTEHEEFRIGANLGLQANLAGLGYQNLLPGVPGNFTTFVLNDGTSLKPYIGLFGEYVSGGLLGAQFRISYDSRSASVTDESYNPNPQYDLFVNYITVEPLLRLSVPGISGLHAVAGPQVSFLLNSTTDYYANKDGDITTEGAELTDMKSVTLGLNVGLGYDIPVGENSAKTQRYYVTPFVESSWMINQRGSSFTSISQDAIDDVWSTVSLRFGVRASVGFVQRKQIEIDNAGDMFVSLFTPADGVLRSRSIDDYFPLLNYVFFDDGKSELPDRYVRLSNSDAATFTEESLANPSTSPLDQYSTNQMNAYYNVLNVLGSRMKANPTATIQLIGSAGVNGNDGEQLAQTVKDYLTNAFGIAENRISVSGQKMPRRPSGSSATAPEYRPLTDAENRRVEIVTTSSALKEPVRVRTRQENPLDNDLVFSLDESLDINSWQVSIEGEGVNKTFGPFTESNERINPSDLMAGLQRGNYKAKVFISTNDGKTLSQERPFQLVRKPEEVDSRIGQRYSLIFEFGQSDPVKLYESFVKEKLVPLVEPNSRVIVHGHTDIVGSDEANLRISTRRAKEVRDLFRSEFAKPGRRKAVQLEYKGFGKDEKYANFRNVLPEERFYNRGVTIDIVPPQK